MAEVLQKVKKDLGREAVILHTRTFRKGGVLGLGARTIVEITASRDINVLPPAERKAIIGRRRGVEEPSPESPPRRRGRSRVIAEGAAMPAAAPVKAQRKPGPVSSDASTLQAELGELRSMVRQLLAQSEPGSRRMGGGADVPSELQLEYTSLIQNAVADEVAREVIDRAQERLAEARLELRESARHRPGGHGTLPRTPGLPGEDDGAAEDSSATSNGFSTREALREIIPTVLVEVIEQMVPAAEPLQLPADGSTKHVALVGPTGVGKTTTIAKLAAHFKLREGRRVGLVTIDTYRIAAVDQLKAYADILGVPLEIVLTPAELRDVLDRMRGLDLVLIDTSGRSQKDAERLSELKQFLDAAREAGAASAGGMETHLVLSCTSHPEQLMEVAERFGALGVDRVVFTKLDEAVGLGVILNVIRRMNLQSSYLTTGQDVPDDIEVGHGRRIAQLIVGGRLDRPADQEPTVMPASVDQVV